MPIYNKLVRDNIPEIIEKSGKKADFYPLENDDDFLFELRAKLQEEVDEFSEECFSDDKSKKVYEISDILEVLDYIMKALDISKSEIEFAREMKNMSNGGFDKRFFLNRVED